MLSLAALALAFLSALAAPPKFDPEKLPYRAAWGPYTILVEKTGDDEFAPQRARILDERGEVAREIRDQRIMDVSFPRLLPGEPEALRVTTFSGGAHCCSTDYFFTRQPTLRNLLIFDGQNGGINALKDLNGDGRLEILASSDVLAYFGGLPYAASPHLHMVLGWDGKRYVDQTRRYPQRSHAQAREERAHFLAVLRRRGEEGETERRSAAAGYYGSSLAIGEGSAALAWLLKHAPASTRRWLQREDADLKASVAASPDKISVSQEKLLTPDEPD